MHYLRSRDLYFSTTCHPYFYDITHKTLVHIHPVIDTEAYKGEDIPSKKDMESESSCSGSVSIIHPKISLKTRRSFRPE